MTYSTNLTKQSPKQEISNSKDSLKGPEYLQSNKTTIGKHLHQQIDTTEERAEGMGPSRGRPRPILALDKVLLSLQSA